MNDNNRQQFIITGKVIIVVRCHIYHCFGNLYNYQFNNIYRNIYTTVAPSEAWTVFARSNCGIVGSKPT